MTSVIKSVKTSSRQHQSRQQNLFAVVLVSTGSLLSFAPGAFTAAKAEVIGTDDRTTPSYEWMTRPGQQRAAFGQLEIKQQDGKYYSCSFTVVGRNIGLTAAHCVMDSQGKPVSQIKAYAARHGNYPGTTTPRYKALANVDWFVRGTNVYPSNAETYAKDWAVIHFTSNIGDITGGLGNVAYGDGGKALAGQTTNYIGYPGDWTAGTPAMHSGCKFAQLSGGVLLHTCDTAPGASGAGMYYRVADDNLQVQAVHNSNGWRLTDGSRANGGAPLDAFMPTLKYYRGY